MTRPLRIDYPGAWHHVLNRGRHKEAIFRDENDYRIFMRVLEQASRLCNIEIHAYSLLPNHYHLLIHTPQANLSKGMKHLNGVYTQKYNKRHNVDGSIFRGRYKSILVDEDAYLLELVRYIHRNAYKAGLDNKIGQYRWDSHKQYLAEAPEYKWLRTEDVLVRFGKTRKEAARALDIFVKKEMPKSLTSVLDSEKWPSVLGADKFKQNVKDLLKEKAGDKQELTGFTEYKTRDDTDYKKITDKILSREKKALKAVKERSFSKKRRALVYLLRLCGNNLKDIGRFMGGVSYSYISKQYKRAEEEIKKKQGCYREVMRIAKGSGLEHLTKLSQMFKT